MKDTIFEKVLKTFYWCFIASFIASLAFAEQFDVATVKAITISCMASSISGAMNYFLRYLDEKESEKSEQKILESSNNKNNKDNSRNSPSNDWDKYLH